MLKPYFKISLYFLILVLIACQPEWVRRAPKYDYSAMDSRTVDAHKKIEEFVFFCVTEKHPVKLHRAVRIDSIKIDEEAKYLEISFNKPFSYLPLREDNVGRIYSGISKLLGSRYSAYKIAVRTLNFPLEALIPNFYRYDSSAYDLSRMPDLNKARPLPIVRNSKSASFTKGLYGYNMALRHSHGWYYNNTLNRWEWQRPRLFQTVEDILPMSFTIPYLLPMLENAGANVFLSRERDFQLNEVIVDNDSTGKTGRHYAELSLDNLHQWQTADAAGFAIGEPPYKEGLNPFALGSSRKTESDTLVSARATWMPLIPETGNYAVYVSFDASQVNVVDARYTVYHAGGRSEFNVNQQIGGGTWIYLGRFKFMAGLHPDSGKVELTNLSEAAGKTVSADAVRFGGGMGNVVRGGTVSGRPRYLEGARYYLQYAGFPDSLVYHLNENNDYKDDYMSRAEFVNYLYGAPFGPNDNRDAKGLGMPIDVSLSFHTDAGISRNDTTIGTLMIYSITDADTQNVFPDGMSRLANLDLGDILQTQIVEDIRNTFDPAWSRRSLYEAQYSETVRTNVPTALLELLSHQNFTDMKFALDPRFRFVAARAIYKGMLKFNALQYRRAYVVQPLPVTHFSAAFDSSGNAVLNWKPQTDRLEPSAMPRSYRIYKRIENGGFDDGFEVQDSFAIIKNLEPGVIFSFKVTALNQGGESFPSEILSLCRADSVNETVLIVNGFDRVGPPAYMESDKFSGFFNELDNGVPDKYDLSFSGAQFDFDPDSKIRLNDAPGHGASHADYETTTLPGNTFDFPYIHGKSIRAVGYGFVSCSEEAVEAGLINLNDYKITDFILGEEKETHWQKAVMDTINGLKFKTISPALQKKIENYTDAGGNIFISGAHIGTDMFAGKSKEHADVQFARNTLKFNWVTDHASRRGNITSVHPDSLELPKEFLFNTEFIPDIYRVESPDAINPEKDAQTILRYSENGFSAAIAFSGKYNLIVFAFPFETIIGIKSRDVVMRSILNYLKKQGL